MLRYHRDGRPVGELPTVAAASGDLPPLWLAEGTIVRWPGIGGRPARETPLEERWAQPWDMVEHPWQGDGVLILSRRGRAHSIWHFWENDRFAGWYVNLEAPWARSPLGFDTEDHELDIWVASDGTWRWKDENELDLAVTFGRFTPEQARAFRAEGERVLEEWPFPTGWEEWRPGG